MFHRRYSLGLTAFTLLALTASSAPADAQIQSRRIATGLDRPVFATAPPGEAERLYVLEQPGVIRIIKNEVLQPEPFLDIESDVHDQFNEQGLLGLAWDPDYDTNGYFYVYHIAGTSSGNSVIRRFTAITPDSADVSSRKKIFKQSQPFTNHNGGTIEFGPNDGYLYVGLGDGGSGGDPGNRAQNGLSYMGKVLRIDVNGDDFPADSVNNYAIPPDNPFVGEPGFLDEIWTYGWRNPYRMSFDENGDLYAADVGQSCWEEVSFQPRTSLGGENFGWRIAEGNHCYNVGSPSNCFSTGCSFAGLTMPIHEYQRGGSPFRCSITGGFVYRGSEIPSLVGYYLFADYCSGQVWSFQWDGANVNDFQERTAELDPAQGGGSIGSITGFGRDGLGELYIIDDSNQVFKIIPDPTSVTPNPRPISQLAISAAAPNPFRDVTQFSVQLESPANLEVNVYDAGGRLVRELNRDSAVEGVVNVEWDGRDQALSPVPSGVYFVRAIANGQAVSKSVTVLR